MSFQNCLLKLSDDEARCLVEKAVEEFINVENHALLSQGGECPNSPGIYCIFKGEHLWYVGESGNLSARIRDLFRTVNHSFRRALGAYLYAQEHGFIKASSKSKFPPEIEKKLTEYMESDLKFVVVPITLGRKEVEEFICKKYEPDFNVRGRRNS
jgi:hypothetical protein